MPYRSFNKRKKSTQKSNAKRRKTTRKSFGKKRKSFKRSYSRGRDPSVVVNNPGKERSYTIVKSTVPTPPFTAAVTTNGNALALNLGPGGYNFFGLFTFDPSGTYGNFSGSVSSATPTLAPVALSQWTALAGLYEEYKVVKIVLRARYTDSGDADFTTPEIWMRYNYVHNATAPSWANAGKQRNWMVKKFNAGAMDFKYTLTPRVIASTDNVEPTPTTSKYTRKMRWTSVDSPAELLGFQLMYNWPSQGNGTGFVNWQVEYHMKFRKPK